MLLAAVEAVQSTPFLTEEQKKRHILPQRKTIPKTIIDDIIKGSLI